MMGGEVHTPTVDEVSEKFQSFADEKQDELDQEAEELELMEAEEGMTLDDKFKVLA